MKELNQHKKTKNKENLYLCLIERLYAITKKIHNELKLNNELNQCSYKQRESILGLAKSIQRELPVQPEDLNISTSKLPDWKSITLKYLKKINDLDANNNKILQSTLPILKKELLLFSKNKSKHLKYITSLPNDD